MTCYSSLCAAGPNHLASAGRFAQMTYRAPSPTVAARTHNLTSSGATAPLHNPNWLPSVPETNRCATAVAPGPGLPAYWVVDLGTPAHITVMEVMGSTLPDAGTTLVSIEVLRDEDLPGNVPFPVPGAGMPVPGGTRLDLFPPGSVQRLDSMAVNPMLGRYVVIRNEALGAPLMLCQVLVYTEEQLVGPAGLREGVAAVRAKGRAAVAVGSLPIEPGWLGEGEDGGASGGAGRRRAMLSESGASAGEQHAGHEGEVEQHHVRGLLQSGGGSGGVTRGPASLVVDLGAPRSVEAVVLRVAPPQTYAELTGVQVGCRGLPFCTS